MAKRRHRTRLPSSAQVLAWGVVISLIVCLAGLLQSALTPLDLPEEGDSPHLYSNQTRHDLRRLYIAAINRAQSSLVMVIYSLRDTSIIQALRAKAEEGVRVEVLCDAKASAGVARRLGRRVKTIYRQAKGLMHQKLLVVDGAEVWVGSANMTTESLRHHGNLVVGLRSRELAAFISERAAAMIKGSEGCLAGHRVTLLKGQEAELWFLPDQGLGVEKIEQLIAGAAKTLHVAMFTFTHPRLEQALVDAKKRGVKVEVVIDRDSSKGASSKVFRSLQRHGVVVAVSESTALLHHKMMVVDGKILVEGSANWTRAAFAQNDDCFMILHNLTPKQAQELDALWQVIWQESSKGSYGNSQSFLDEIKRWLSLRRDLAAQGAFPVGSSSGIAAQSRHRRHDAAYSCSHCRQLSGGVAAVGYTARV